jgi:DNA modification methylase
MMEQIASRITLHSGDCLDILPTLAECSIDSCVTDPPYGLSFMGRNWDHGVPGIPFWKEVYRVLKPGAHLVAFGGSRTYHRMACAIEDAGFEIRDSLMWIYGTGFPKSHDVSKGIDKAAGAEREVVGEKSSGLSAGTGTTVGKFTDSRNERGLVDITAPATDAAREWQGWGTALKPAFEPIVLARKPLSESTVAANVLRWRTGALNIDGCRIETTEVLKGSSVQNDMRGGKFASGHHPNCGDIPAFRQSALGRWPANVCHDGSDEIVAAFPTTAPGKKNNAPQEQYRANNKNAVYGKSMGGGYHAGFDDQGNGSAVRFFYSAKASKADRAGSKHPTVKPVSLMQWLCRLITPPGGTVLDPFAGSGTTGAAARNKGFNCILIEREAEYQQDIRNRFASSADLLEAAE